MELQEFCDDGYCRSEDCTPHFQGVRHVAHSGGGSSKEARAKLFNKSDEKALYSKDKSNKGKPKDPKKAEEAERKKKMKCFYCEKLGHSAKECRKKKADQKRMEESKGKEEAKTESANVSTGELFVLTEHCSAYVASDDKEG